MKEPSRFQGTVSGPMPGLRELLAFACGRWKMFPVALQYLQARICDLSWGMAMSNQQRQPRGDIAPVMENHMEKNLEHGMETGGYTGASVQDVKTFLGLP